MSQISISRTHALSLDQARTTAEALAGELAARYALNHYWQENSLHFQRTGVTGQIDLEPGIIHINVRLGLLMAALKSYLEPEIDRKLNEILDAA